MEKTDNELIAEFMDEAFIREKNWHRSHWRHMPFSKSWDWLMPVVEKIASMGQVPFFVVTELPITSNIKDVYVAVVNFIKWYNHNQKEF